MFEVIDKVVHDTSGLYGAGDITDRPCPSITVGVHSVNSLHYQVHFHRTPNMPTKPKTKPTPGKPPYRVPTMAEVSALPWNGFNAISTFSGGGGSSTGYRMAGFKVLWASEFIDAARDTYAANMAPHTVLDGRDIREVQASEILEAIKMRPGDLDLFDGSPPCASFSTAGKRQAGWGKVKKYSDKAQRTDDLFFEYVRLLRGLKPKVFVAENVSGLVKGAAKGYFLEILRELKASGYRVTCKVLDAQWLGVPQSRQRTIFVGVREDLGLDPVHPLPLPYRYSIRDALPWVVNVIEGVGPNVAPNRPGNTFPRNVVKGGGLPAGAVTAQAGQVNASPALVEAETDISRFAIGEEWERMGRPGTQSEKFFQLVRPSLDSASPTITGSGGAGSIASVCHPTEKRKFSIAELKRICAFPDDYVLTGTYAQQWERCGRSVPPVMMAHIAAAIRDGILGKLPCAG